MKQPFILTLVSSVACAATAANKAPENTTPTKSKTPNVVFIYADDLGYGDLECYGAKNVQTPNVNRLAKSGILFTNAHATAATSTPSRYSMLTGEYAWRKEGTDVAAGNAGASARIDFEKAAESLVGFWDLLLEKLPVNYPKLTVQLKLGSLKHPKDILAATSESEFPAIVYKIAEAEIQVMEQASGLRNMSDTKILGGNTFGGSLVFTFNKVLNDPKSKACFIDTTPAGLHESKTKIG